MSGRSVGTAALAAAICGVVTVPRTSGAALVFDILATTKNSIAIPAGTAQKTQSGFAVGDVFHVTISAVLSGTDSNLANEGFASVQGTMLSSGGAARGDIHAATYYTDPDTGEVTGPFFTRQTWSTWENVTPPRNKDLDGDGDLDVGISPTPVNGATEQDPFPPFKTWSNYIFYNPSMQTTTSNPLSARKVLGEVDVSITTASAGSGMIVNYILGTEFGTGNSPLWRQDGRDKTIRDGGFSVSPFTLQNALPEPASLGLLGAAAFGLLRRRPTHARH